MHLPVDVHRHPRTGHHPDRREHREGRHLTGEGAWRLRDEASGTVIADRVTPGTSFWQRFRGLMGRDSLEAGEGLYLPEASIHMFFMRFPIDALFVARADPDGSRRVVDVRHDLRPWRDLVMTVRGAEGVVELPAGSLRRASVQAGATVRFETAGSDASSEARPVT